MIHKVTDPKNGIQRQEARSSLNSGTKVIQRLLNLPLLCT